MRLFTLCLAVLISSSCFGYVSNFSKGPDGWEGAFVDYPVGEEDFYELGWGWGNLPHPFDGFQKGLHIEGNNHSDDLFMFFRKKVAGLKPNTTYCVSYSLWIESNVPADTMGIGGSPGESVFFKVGGAAEKPKKIVENGYYRLSVDKANQGQEGIHAKIIGDLANPDVDPALPSFKPKRLSGVRLPVQTDETGALWLFFGTDSGFEGFSKFYLAQVSVEIAES